MYELEFEGHFASAHCLREYRGKCERLHGHNWRVRAVVQAEELDRLGMVMDFKDAKAALNAVIDEFDHNYLNDLPRFKTLNPTTENMARVIHDELGPRLPAGVSVKSVSVWESGSNGATYRA